MSKELIVVKCEGLETSMHELEEFTPETDKFEIISAGVSLEFRHES